MRRAALLLQRQLSPAAAEGWLPSDRGTLSRPHATSSSSHLNPLTTTTVLSSTISPTHLLPPHLVPSPLRSLSLFSTATNSSTPSNPQGSIDETEGEEWQEEEDYAEPVFGDGGGGGGVVLGDIAWGERALAVAREVLLQCGDDLAIYAFKISSKGYVYVRLDKLTDKHGCPSMEDIKKFNNLYKKRLDEIEESGVAIEVSSPGAERLLKVPEDLDRFKELPMWVQYVEEGSGDSKHQQIREKVFLLESISTDANTGYCVWKLADVKENRAELGKGRPLSRKHKDWRLRLPFTSIRRVMLFLDTNGKLLVPGTTCAHV